MMIKKTLPFAALDAPCPRLQILSLREAAVDRNDAGERDVFRAQFVVAEK